MENETGKKVYAKKAYMSTKNRRLFKDLGKEDGILYKATRNSIIKSLKKDGQLSRFMGRCNEGLIR